MLLAVCGDLARITRVGVYDHDLASALVDGLAIEDDPLPIGRPRRVVVAPAFGGVGDLADMASIGVHREERALGLIGIEPAAKGDLTVRSSGIVARTLLVVFLAASTAGAQRHSNESRQYPCSQQCTCASHDHTPCSPTLCWGCRCAVQPVAPLAPHAS